MITVISEKENIIYNFKRLNLLNEQQVIKHIQINFKFSKRYDNPKFLTQKWLVDTK